MDNDAVTFTTKYNKKKTIERPKLSAGARDGACGLCMLLYARPYNNNNNAATRDHPQEQTQKRMPCGHKERELKHNGSGGGGSKRR